jgi:hypothetical protein
VTALAGIMGGRLSPDYLVSLVRRRFSRLASTSPLLSSLSLLLFSVVFYKTGNRDLCASFQLL